MQKHFTSTVYPEHVRDQRGAKERRTYSERFLADHVMAQCPVL